jgi:glucan biosynthesis protein
MKDAVITVTLKNGKTYQYSANEYKVVRRGSKAKTPEVQVVTSEPAAPLNRNRVQLHAGVGYKGFYTSVNSSDIIVKEKRVPVFGVSYFRLLNEDTSIGATVMSNGVYTLGVGKDF